LVEAHVTLHERPHEETCPFCHDTIRAEQEVWPCDRCGTRLHAECFHDNKDACTVLGCTGRAKVPAARVDRSGDPRFSEEARLQRKERRMERRAQREVERVGQRIESEVARDMARRREDRDWFRGWTRVAVILSLPFITGVYGLKTTDKSTGVFFFCLFGFASVAWLFALWVNPDDDER
jgi:hypothetical protein